MDDDWESSDDEDDDTVYFVLALAIEGERRKEESAPKRGVLHRCDMHHAPRWGSSWEATYAAGNDEAFILTTGFDVATFHYMLREFETRWSQSTIPRPDVQVHGDSRPDRRCLSATAALALVLHYLNSTMAEHSLQQIFAVTPSVCSRYLRFGLQILRMMLRRLPEARIKWPSSREEFDDYASMIHLRHPMLHGGFCFVDGLNLPVSVATDDEVQNAYYNGWTCSHYCSCIFAFAPDGRIIFATINAPGSWHDAAIARGLYEELDANTPEGFYAIADTAFPRNQKRMKGKIRTPLKSTDALPRNLQRAGRIRELNHVRDFNSQLVSARQADEWGMRALQGSFSRLKMPLPALDHEHRQLVLEVCARLHQVRTVLVGVNQIKNVYERVWKDDDPNALVYENFRTMVFRDIRRNDRIARYYALPQTLIDIDDP